jgi:hypothetical protein
MKARCLLLVSVAMAAWAAPAAAVLTEVPVYNYAQISTANSTVDLIPAITDFVIQAHVYGIKCIFPSNAGGASVNVNFTFPGSPTHTITIDPTYLEQDDGNRYVSGWIPMKIDFFEGSKVQLNNTSLGTATINCWAAWTYIPIPE